MSRTRYSISWLYGEFRIARFHRGTIAAQWEAPGRVETHADLVRALDAASNHVDLGIKGDVTVVHEHDLHTHDYLEVPSMKRRDLEKYLQRRVQQDKSFDEDAAWCYHKVSHRGGKEGVLLHLLPKRLVKSTTAACTAVGLAPKNYVPLTEIVSDYLPTKDIAHDHLVVVVACFNERTEIILALGDGEALFVRELNYGLSAETVDRLVQDINRTMRYTRQQLGRSVDGAWMMGRIAPEFEAQLEIGVEMPVHFDREAEDPYFWAEWATHLSGKLSANFISVFAQKNMTGEVFRRIGAWSTAAVLAVAAFMTLFTGGLVAHRADQMRDIQQRSDQIRDLIATVEEKVATGKSKQDHLTRLRATSHNLPSLMMVHMSRLTPEEVVLTEVTIERSGGGWRFALRGTVTGDLRHGARVLARFEEELAQPPWRVQLRQSFTETWMEQFEQGMLSDSGRLGFQIAGDLL